MDSTTYQKPPKVPGAKGMEISDKPLSFSKGNTYIAPKQTPQELPSTVERRPVAQTGSQSFALKAATPALKVPVIPNGAERVPESSLTSAPSRTQVTIRDEKKRLIHLSGQQLQTSNDKSRQVPGENSLQQPQPGDERRQKVQLSNERLRQGLTGKERKQNGFQSEQWWKESSAGFDAYGDDRPDRPTDREEAEYLSHQDVALDLGRTRSREKVMHPDDMADIEYEHGGMHDQSGYYDTELHGSYEQKQKRGYDHRSSFDNIGRQHNFPYNARVTESVLARERRGAMAEQEIQKSSGDLRNHLAKRRRNDRAQLVSMESQSRRVHQDVVNNFHHNQRHQEEPPKHQEALVRSSEQGARSNHRRPSGRVESGGVKRPYHDVGSDYESASPDRVKDKEIGRYVTEAASVVEPGGYATSKNKKPEPNAESSTFAGPKSLAQIKAEKRRAGSEAGYKGVDGPEGPRSQVVFGTHSDFADQRPVLALKSQISQASGSSSDKVQKEGSSKDEMKASSDNLSEGPKGLSLKAKGKSESSGDVRFEESRNELAFKRSSLAPGVEVKTSTTNLSSLDLSKDMEDGEVMPDAKDVPEYSSEAAKGTEWTRTDFPEQYLPDIPLQEGLPSSLTGEEVTAGEVQRNQGEDVKGGLVSSEDTMEDALDTGDNISDGDYTFDDDEEDDFAKKLGGYFS